MLSANDHRVRLDSHMPLCQGRLQVSATTMLESVTMHGGTEASSNEKAIPSLVKLLGSGDIPVLVGACRVLINITMNLNHAQVNALDNNVIPRLIRLLSVNGVRVQKSATFVLMNHTLHGPVRDAVITSEGILNLVRLLSSNIQASAATVLENITVSGGVEIATNAKAIPYLVRLLTSDNAVVLITVCAVLNITMDLDWARAQASDAGVIPLLSFNDTRVQNSATIVLMNLTLHGDASAAAITSGAIPNLVHLLASDDTQTQASAAAVLENITVQNAAEVAVEENVIPSLVRLLDSRNAAVLIVSCSALKNITSFGHARAEAFNANAIASLVVLLVLEDVRVQRSAILALQNITLHTPAMAAALTSNVIPSLVHLLASNEIGIQASAAAALENITADGGADAVEANAIPALVRLLSSKNVDVLIAVCGGLKNMILAPRTRAGTNNQKALKSHLHILIYSNNECVKPTAQELLKKLN